MVRRIASGKTADAIGEVIADWADELEGYEDLHASAAMRRDLFRNLGPRVIEEAMR
jgi:CO/xanthine dehydrogenase FAD-binding subunit